MLVVFQYEEIALHHSARCAIKVEFVPRWFYIG
jgi:hypothetical protein